MKQKIIILLMICTMLFTGCTTFVSTEALAAVKENPKTYMIIDTPVYIIANGYGNFQRTMDEGYPIEEILSSEGSKAELMNLNKLSEEVENNNKKGYNSLTFKFEQNMGEKYNFWYGTPTIEFKGSARGVVDLDIAKEMRSNIKDDNTSANIEFKSEAPYYEIYYIDPYNGGEIKKEVPMSGDNGKDRAVITDLLTQLHNDALSRVYKESEYIETLKNILKKCEDSNDKARATEIYKWIIKNIQYDFSKVEDNGSAIKTLKERKAKCFGYAYTFDALGKGMGLKIYIVMGIGENDDHVWNILQTPDGNEYAIDCTWGVNDQAGNFVQLPDTEFSKKHSVWSSKEGKYISFKDFSSYVLLDE